LCALAAPIIMRPPFSQLMASAPRRERRSFEGISTGWGFESGCPAGNGFSRLGGSRVTDPKIEVPDLHAIGSDIPVTYVPFRNPTFFRLRSALGRML